MRPVTPPELDEDNRDIPAEAMMFVGDKGKILAGFNVQQPQLIPAKRMQGQPAPPPRPPRETGEPALSPGLHQWVAACRGGEQSPGNFTNAGPISEAVNLWAVALRTGRKLVYDPATATVTNYAAANKYLSREYRKGFDPDSI